jgi:O-antigen/teichoic acid export membrane protein
VQVLRGGLLWLGCLGIAAPAAAFYGQEALQQLLPVAGLSVLILGFASINMATVNRNLMLGRLTTLELGAQGLGIAVMVVAALILQSVWALVIGGLVDAVTRLVLSHLILPGRRARFALERPALLELFHFGKWIFLSTVAGFLLQHGDRVILGRYITLTDLAFYNIGFFLATVPEMLNGALNGRILFPLYCNKPPAESAENRAKTLRARVMLTAGGFALSVPLIFFGDELVTLLYDPRYHSAGPILVAICLARLFQITTSAYGSVLLAVGASRQFAGLMITASVLRSGMMLLGAIHFGIPGVVIGTLLGEMLIYPILVWLIRPHQAWDWRHDLGFVGLAAVIGVLAAWQDPAAWSAFADMAMALGGDPAAP